MKNGDVRVIKHVGMLHWYHWLVVCSSLILTVSAWYVTSEQGRQKTQMQFDYQAEQIIQLVRERMGKYEEALWAGTAMIHSHPGAVDTTDWQIFSEALSIEEKYPGINGIGVIYFVTPDEREAFLAEQRLLRPDFGIHPSHHLQEYWPITYIEPVDINQKAVGLDMAYETNRHMAAKQARDTGTTQITGPITLVQDAKHTPGFLFFAPFYKQLEIASDITVRKKSLSVSFMPLLLWKSLWGERFKIKTG